MIERVIIAGAGGQGIMLLGKVLAEAAMRENKFVTLIPCYGAEVRGGTAHCMVTISDAEIGSPYIDQADSLLIMNHPSLEKFKYRIKNNGLFIINSSLVQNNIQRKHRILEYPFTDIAIKLGNIKVANMVALGCYIKKRGIVGLKSILEAICQMAPENKKDLVDINKQAVSNGAELND